MKYVGAAHPTISARRANQFFLSRYSRENIPVLKYPKSPIEIPPSRSGRGALAIVTNVGMGCGGRGSVGRALDSQGGFPVSDYSAQTNDVAAYGKTVWSWHPLLVSSRRRFCEPNRVRQSLHPPTTVTRRIRRRGERGISRKAIAQGRRNAPTVPVCSCACSYAHIARETAGAASTRRSLRPLSGGRFSTARARGVAGRESAFVIARSTCDEAIHSFFPR
jgi:hypothetical protein